MKLFLPQATLEDWALSEKADVQDGKLIVSDTQASYPVRPAVHFRSLVSGVDEQNLVSRVKTDEQLKALGAEHMSDSVLIGDNAFEVTEGYIAEVVAAAAPAKADKPKAAQETDLLAAFLLDKMS